jgi:hypothetical protein
MKIEIIQGCVSDAILINGIPIQDCHQGQLVDFLLKRIGEEVLAGTIGVKDLIELFQYDSWENVAYCDQCHDDVYKTTYEI